MSHRSSLPPVEPFLPRTQEEARAAGARVGLPIPEACLPGVVANLALLGRHAATLRGGA